MDHDPSNERNQGDDDDRADELQPGDVVAYGGHNHQITYVDQRDGWAWPIAADETGWAIALDHHLIDVHRKAA